MKLIRTLALFAALTFSANVFAQPKDVTQLYAKLKNIENQTVFQLPAPSATLNMGMFNAATNKFEGLVTETADLPSKDDKPKGGKPGPKIIPVERVNAVSVGLIFEAVNHKTPVTFTVNGTPHTLQASKKSVTVNIGRATQVKWSVKSGDKMRHTDTLKLDRPAVIGAGAFTVPALPVALLYEPPQGLLKKNSARYIKTRSEGTTVRLSFSSEDSTTTPTDSEFAGLMTLKDAMGSAAKGLEKVKNPYAQGAAKGLNLLASGLGEASATSTAGTSVTKNHTLAIRNSVTNGFTTAAREGPGAGDVIVYLKNARMVWMAGGGGVRLAFLGADKQVSTTVKELKNELPGLTSPTSRSQRFGLDRATIEALLATDPFVAGGSKATLPAKRFRHIETYELHGSQAFDYEFAFAVEESDLKEQTSFTMRSEDHKKGFLSYVGVGVPETKSTKTVIKYGNSSEARAGEEVRVSGHFETQSGEDYGVTAYYDRAFGTLVFAPVAQGSEQVVGVVADAAGKPLVRQRVTLVANGRKFTTTTDAQGRYSFRSTGIAQGPAIVSAGATRREVTITGAPVKGVELRLNK